MFANQLCAGDNGMLWDNPTTLHRAEECAAEHRLSLPDVLKRFEAEAVHGTCDTGRYRCNYSIWGSGPPLVFVHGLSDLPRSFVLPMALLSRRFQCIAYALPDGRNDGADLKHHTHADMVADLFVLLDWLGIERTYLFGSSFGSTITLAALRAQPARIVRAVLQGGFARRPVRLVERLFARLTRSLPGRMGHLPLRRLLLTLGQEAPFAARPPEIRQFLLDCTGTCSVQAFTSRVLMMDALDLRPILTEISQPVLLVCGATDPLVGNDREAELLQGLPVVRRVEMAGCAHFPYFTHPEALADIVQSFLTPTIKRTAPHAPAASRYADRAAV